MSPDTGSSSQVQAGPSSPSRPPPTVKTKRPKESRFLQQNLPACKPLLTPEWVIGIYMLVGAIFVPIGVLALMASKNVVEIVDRYDDACVPVDNKLQFIQSVSTNKQCTRQITVPKVMKPPIFVYYELDNFYQNHRRYVKSRSDGQLLHNSSSDTSNCKPEQVLGTNTSLTIIPCGLIAWSLFNDTYRLSFATSKNDIHINKTGISWKSDRDHKFGATVYPQNFPNNRNDSGVLVGGAKLNESVPLNQDEDLMVWMRTAALPTFRKLYGRIEQRLEANTNISIHITNVYNTYSFGGKKKVVLSTADWLGGKNDFLGIAYITIGSLCFFLALVFLVAHLTNRRPIGDIRYLSWNKNVPEVQQMETQRH